MFRKLFNDVQRMFIRFTVVSKFTRFTMYTVLLISIRTICTFIGSVKSKLLMKFF
jgi:hypothetical protein